MKKVQILLSSYNGEKFIEEQIDSILNQKDVDIRILIRDDGSKDESLNKIDSYKKRYGDKVDYLIGENVGPTRSFLKLLFLAGDADYYAFSDQDDVWEANKIITAVTKLEKYENVPAIYSSNTNLVNQNLELIKKENKNPKTTLESAIIKNYATGCTVVFNKELIKKIKEIDYKIDIPFHDWWLNILTLAIGGVSIFDTDAFINYRQHNNNVVGGSEKFVYKWKNRFKRFKKPYFRDNMANLLLANYDDEISQKNKEVLNMISDYKKNKFKIIFNKNFKTGNRIDDFLFKICVVLNRI